MGGCQINGPCFNDIKSKDNSPIIINNTLNNSNVNHEEPKVSNEEIDIALPVSPLYKINDKKGNKYNEGDKKEINELNNNKEMAIDNNNQKGKLIDNKIITYESLQIEEIISEEKIHTKNNHEIVFRGNLLLISKTGDFENMEIYCVMSRINLKLYKNINFFLKMKKPLFIVDLRLAKNIQIIKDEKLGLCFSLLDKYIFNSENKELIFKWIVILNYFSNKLL